MSFFLYSRTTGDLMELTKDISFGRVNGDWTFPDDDVISSTHGQFVIKTGAVYLLDKGSTNGTFINKKEMDKGTPVKLEELDQISFGTQEFIFTTNPRFSPDDIEQALVDKKREELRASIKKGKEAKIKELVLKKDQLQGQNEDMMKNLQDLKAKAEEANAKTQAKDKTCKDLQAKITNLETNMEQIKAQLEKDKIPFYAKKTDFSDKIQLLKMANAAPEELAIPIAELKKVEEKLAQLESEKQGLPNKLVEFKASLKTNSEELEKLQLNLKNAIDNFNQVKNELVPKIEDNKIQLQHIDAQVHKIIDETTKTKD